VGARIIDLSHRVFKNFFTVVQEIRFFEEARCRSIEPLILFIIDPDPKSAKAYGMLRHQLSQASLLPVRNQTLAEAAFTLLPCCTDLQSALSACCEAAFWETEYAITIGGRNAYQDRPPSICQK
jgi:hypothetical protein